MQDRENKSKGVSRLSACRRIWLVALLAVAASLAVATPAHAQADDEIKACVIQERQAANPAQVPGPGDENGVNGEIVDSTATQFQAIAADGAVPALTAAFEALDLSTSPTVDPNQIPQGGTVNRWFGAQYSAMVQVGIWIMLPMLMIAIIHAIVRGSLQQLVRSVLVYLPIAVIGSVVAIQIVQVLINIADSMSTLFMRQMNSNLIPFMCGVQTGFFEHGKIWIVSAFLALLLIGACVALLFVLILREASIYLATFFLPLGFAMLVWPATSRWLRRLAEFLIAMIFSKVVMMAAIAMGVAALGATVGFDPASVGGVTPNGGSVTQPQNSAGQTLEDPADQSTLDWILMTSDAILILGIAAFSPAMLNGVVGQIGIGGEMAGNVQQNLQRHSVVTIFNTFERSNALRANVIGRGPNQPGVPANLLRVFRRPPPPSGGA